MQTANREVMNMEGVVSLLTSIGELHVHAWLGIFENLVVDIFLGASIIDQCICGIFLTPGKIVPCHTKPVEII